MAIGVGGGDLTPAVSPLSTIKRKVLNYVQAPNDSDLLDAAKCAIELAIQRLNTRTWTWTLTSQDITFAASTQTYTVNQNFKKARALHLFNSSSKVNGRLLYKLPKEFLDDFLTLENDGVPQYYSVIKPKDDLLLSLSRAPQSGWVTDHPTGRLYYYKRLAFPANDAAVIDCVSEAEAFIVWYARSDISAQYGEPGMTDRADRRWSDIWNQLIRDDYDELSDWDV